MLIYANRCNRCNSLKNNSADYNVLFGNDLLKKVNAIIDYAREY